MINPHNDCDFRQDANSRVSRIIPYSLSGGHGQVLPVCARSVDRTWTKCRLLAPNTEKCRLPAGNTEKCRLLMLDVGNVEKCRLPAGNTEKCRLLMLDVSNVEKCRLPAGNTDKHQILMLGKEKCRLSAM